MHTNVFRSLIGTAFIRRCTCFPPNIVDKLDCMKFKDLLTVSDNVVLLLLEYPILIPSVRVTVLERVSVNVFQ